MSDRLRALFFQRLRDPRSVPILARHAIPIIGVFVFDWSVLETVAALLLDALSTLWLVGAMGSYFAAKEYDVEKMGGVMNTLHFWAAFLGAFVVIAGILSVAVIVPGMFLLPLVQSAEVDPMELLTSGWLPRAFAFMVAFQIPGLVQRIRAAELAGTKPEHMGMDADVGFIMHRTVLLAMIASMLTIFGPYTLHLLVILAQALGAGSEIMRDEYVGYLLSTRRATAPTAPAARAAALRRRRRRRR